MKTRNPLRTKTASSKNRFMKTPSFLSSILDKKEFIKQIRIMSMHISLVLA
jgi:hypothetical protein